MVGHGAKFGRKKEAAIAALLTSRNVEEAAKTIGVGTNTLLRWLEIPEFKKAYLGARRKAVSQAIARVQQTTGPAVSTLQKLMVDPKTSDAVKARIAVAILALSIKGVETEDFEVRLLDLEIDTDPSKKKR
jgi:hypothetical protein